MGDLINFNSPNVVKRPLDTLHLSSSNKTSDRSFDLFNNSFSNVFDLGRESLPLTGRPSITGRESLQILTDLPLLNEAALSLIAPRPSSPFSNLNSIPEIHTEFAERPSLTGRESLQILHDLHNLCDLDVDCGRESLGIIKVTSPEVKVDGDFLRPVDVLIGNSNLSLSPLNTAFLHPSISRCRKSTFSSISSLNSNSLEPEISKIYSISTIASSAELNVGFMESRLISPKCNSHERGLSVAVMENQGDNFVELCKRRCVSELNRKSSSNGSRRSSNLDEENDDVFSDSIFIEAHHLASKMADGSILDDSFEANNILDSTPHPQWEASEEPEDELPKCNKEEVFKTVDKLLPVIKLNNTTSEITERNDSSSDKSDNSKNGSRGELMQNLSDIFNNEKRINVSRASSTSAGSKSRDAKEILQNLSVILTSENLDPEQKLAGQSLLYNLADILCGEDEKKSESFEDSGHSSFDAEEKINVEPERSCFDVLDLRMNVEPKDKPIDLSVRSKGLSHSFSFPSPKVPPPKLSNNLKSQAEAMKRITASVESNQNNHSRLNGLSSNNISSRLKPKKTEEKVSSVKKGPLRAIIPLNVMAKKKEIEPAPKLRRSIVDQTPPKKFLPEPITKIKKTSTPINDPKLKPVAQSTPDDCNRYTSGSSQLKKKFTCPVSPLARPQMKGKLSTPLDLNKSDSLPDIVNNNNVSTSSDSGLRKGLNRRKSASDLKSSNVRLPLKRSYSIGKENHLSSLKRPVERSKPILEKDSKPEQKIPIRDTSNRSLIKPFNLMSKLKGSRKSEKPVHN